MLRTSIRSVRAIGSRPLAPAAGRQWRPAVARAVNQRYYVDEKRPSVEPVAVIPKSETPIEVVRPDSIPTPSPPPPPPSSSKVAPISTPPPLPPPAPKKKKGFFRRLRNYILTLTLAGAILFGGGVFYSRINDNFHDFFTQYVPYGETAVLYLEEMDFRKRFPTVTDRKTSHRGDATAVTVPAGSGASWRVADSGNTGPRQSNAVKEGAAKVKAESSPVAEAKKEAKKKEAAAPAPVVATPVTAPKEEPAPAKAAKPFKRPAVDEPSRWPPAGPIELLRTPDDADPVVADLVHMLNNIITVINADGTVERYGRTLDKAKEDLQIVPSKIKELKEAVEKQAAEKVKSRMDEFDKAANQLVSRVESAMAAQEVQWRHEFEEEMKRLKQSYDEKVKTVQEREQQISEEKTKNRLLEQAVELQRQFAKEVKQRVESEREGRLGKLSELTSAVSELDKLTTGWNDVVDSTLRTQKLHAAIAAVRASLEDASQPRPMVSEFVALRELAGDDAVIDAAIASINPTVYQRGIPRPADLVDRFRRVAAEVRKASLLPDDAGVASHASSWVLSHVMFKKQGIVAGDDVESILTRAQTYLEEGELDKAAREVNGLSGWAKTLSRDWLNQVRKVLEVQQALEVIQAEARLKSLSVE